LKEANIDTRSDEQLWLVFAVCCYANHCLCLGLQPFIYCTISTKCSSDGWQRVVNWTFLTFGFWGPNQPRNVKISGPAFAGLPYMASFPWLPRNEHQRKWMTGDTPWTFGRNSAVLENTCANLLKRSNCNICLFIHFYVWILSREGSLMNVICFKLSPNPLPINEFKP
jgi:hypothetical protein